MALADREDVANQSWMDEVISEVLGCCDVQTLPDGHNYFERTEIAQEHTGHPDSAVHTEEEPALESARAPPLSGPLASPPGVPAAPRGQQPPPSPAGGGLAGGQGLAPEQLTMGENEASKATPSKVSAKVSAVSGSLPAELRGLTHLDEHKALIYANWCAYCLCCGCGSSPIASPPFMELRCCCCFERCRSDADTSGDGCCSLVQSCCCLLCACQLPRRQQQPFVKCCNAECCSGWRYSHDATSGQPPRASNNRHDVMHEFCVPCYCCWGGCALLPGCEVCASHVTCCGCDVKSQPLIPVCTLESIRYGWCGYFCACSNCYAQCRLPFLCKEIPICACCGWRCRQRAHPTSPVKAFQV